MTDKSIGDQLRDLAAAVDAGLADSSQDQVRDLELKLIAAQQARAVETERARVQTEKLRALQADSTHQLGESRRRETELREQVRRLTAQLARVEEELRDTNAALERATSKAPTDDGRGEVQELFDALGEFGAEMLRAFRKRD